MPQAGCCSLRLSRGLRALQTPLPLPSLSRGASRFYSQLPRHTSQPYRPSTIPKSTRIAFITPSIQTRYNSNESTPPNPLTDHDSDATRDAENKKQNELRRAEEPAYMLAFTCKPCSHRSVHRVSKHGYHRGTVLIQCPGCKNRHVISDHLKIFLDRNKTLEDIMKENGERMVQGRIDTDMEWRDDELMAKEIAEEVERVKAAQAERAAGEKETQQ
ncbi:DNL zinc finger-domain-containing protein [Aspergillus granulosus]|uniref:DNL zinc finger-domain-containing protein n=1 Tax=Aspergillus granulosus TaxID=176169 RepID=A0ABR4H5V8_9EURO